MFNRSFYTPEKRYTAQEAEQKMIEKGYTSFSLTGSSFTNGSSFYFETSTGEKVRVSDHSLTGNRAFEYTQIRFVEPKLMSAKK